jgi:DNA polymerase I-like protein with 3'-5' exonuclease and polymerase domains
MHAGRTGRGRLSAEQLEYAARDAAVLLPLREKLAGELEEDGLGYVSGIEFGAVATISEMELAGVKLDITRWKELERVVRQRRDAKALELEAQFPQPEGVLPLEGLGPSLNLNSPKQITDAFRSLDIELPDTKVWTLLKIDHPAAGLLLEYRELQKKLGTYLETYPGFVNEKTGRIHANFLQCRVPTGRLACTSPNIQQIPHEDEFRRCFVAEKGNVLVISDYSQVELRILAEVSGDPAFVEAFQRGDDLHRVTAATMYGVAMEEVTKDQRSDAKRINFGLMYGRGARSLSGPTRHRRGTRTRAHRRILCQLPKGPTLFAETANRAVRDRTLRTLAGRLRKFGPASTLDDRGAMRREAMNYPIQGASADIAKLALVYIREELRGLDARLVNCIHDEFVVECDENIAPQVEEKTRAALVRAGEEILSEVPVEVEVSTSPSGASRGRGLGPALCARTVRAACSQMGGAVTSVVI